MNNRTAGLLLGAGVALVVAWLLRSKRDRQRHEVHLTLKALPGGGAGFEPLSEHEAYVTLRKSRVDTIHWIITNPATTGYDGAVRVRIDNWQSPSGDVSPVLMPGNSRTVDRGGPSRHIPGVVNPVAPPRFPGEPPVSYKYDVLVDDVVVLDPIVKLVL